MNAGGRTITAGVQEVPSHGADEVYDRGSSPDQVLDRSGVLSNSSTWRSQVRTLIVVVKKG